MHQVNKSLTITDFDFGNVKTMHSIGFDPSLCYDIQYKYTFMFPMKNLARKGLMFRLC